MIFADLFVREASCLQPFAVLPSGPGDVVSAMTRQSPVYFAKLPDPLNSLLVLLRKARSITHGSTPRAEFTKQRGDIGDPSAANLLGGFDLALRQQVMGLSRVAANHDFYRGGPGIIDRIIQICTIRHVATASFGLVLQVPLQRHREIKGTLIWASQLQLRRPYCFSVSRILGHWHQKNRRVAPRIQAAPFFLLTTHRLTNSYPFNSDSFVAVESSSVSPKESHTFDSPTTFAHICVGMRI